MTREEAIALIKNEMQCVLTQRQCVRDCEHCPLIKPEGDILASLVMAIEALQEQKTDEWCTDCKEYDQEKHCCPRFNRVIRQAVSEQKWIPWDIEDDPRLKDHHYYLVTHTAYSTPMKAKYHDDVPHFEIMGVSVKNTDTAYFWEKTVTAWMDLPETYQGDEE